MNDNIQLIQHVINFKMIFCKTLYELLDAVYF